MATILKTCPHCGGQIEIGEQHAAATVSHMRCVAEKFGIPYEPINIDGPRHPEVQAVVDQWGK